jgi:hypothetical protein
MAALITNDLLGVGCGVENLLEQLDEVLNAINCLTTQ